MKNSTNSFFKKLKVVMDRCFSWVKKNYEGTGEVISSTQQSEAKRVARQVAVQESFQLVLSLVISYLLINLDGQNNKDLSWFVFIKKFFVMSGMLFVFFNVLYQINLAGRSFKQLPLKDAFFFMVMLVVSIEISAFLFPTISQVLSLLNIKSGAEYLIPLTAGGLVVHLMMGKEPAYMYAFTFSLLLSYVLKQSYFYALWTFTVNATAILTIRSFKQRTELFRCGLVSGVVAGLLVFCHNMFQSVDTGIPTTVWLPAAFAFVSGGLSAMVAGAIIPIFESGFGYTTSLKLLELSNFNHPLLHELMIKAPGTYHHSVIVGSLAEIAADKIGANGLLARVSAYYHDIGKMGKPLYFIENQSAGGNPHDHLAPSMSARILFSHVKNGVRLARLHKLGRDITGVIEQHHGTTSVSYFLNKAKQHENPAHDHINENDFRYPGPKPQTREAAIVMLADACEAATRAIIEPTPSKIQNTVNQIINQRILDHQFAECDLTFKDLQLVEECFTRTLVSLYHHRIEYPKNNKNASKDNVIPTQFKKVQTAKPAV